MTPIRMLTMAAVRLNSAIAALYWSINRDFLGHSGCRLSSVGMIDLILSPGACTKTITPMPTKMKRIKQYSGRDHVSSGQYYGRTHKRGRQRLLPDFVRWARACSRPELRSLPELRNLPIIAYNKQS